MRSRDPNRQRRRQTPGSARRREIDLCVAVALIGNDPTWVDGGRGAAAPKDWRRRAGDDWAARANAPPDVGSKARGEVLAQILPSLAFADRLSLHGQVLRVQGKLWADRIHVGSGNIMMAPSGRYLSIVPASPAAGATDDAYLPFEGDRMLSIVLSKALMLARDDKITEEGASRIFALGAVDARLHRAGGATVRQEPTLGSLQAPDIQTPVPPAINDPARSLPMSARLARSRRSQTTSEPDIEPYPKPGPWNSGSLTKGSVRAIGLGDHSPAMNHA